MSNIETYVEKLIEKIASSQSPDFVEHDSQTGNKTVVYSENNVYLCLGIENEEPFFISALCVHEDDENVDYSYIIEPDISFYAKVKGSEEIIDVTEQEIINIFSQHVEV